MNKRKKNKKIKKTKEKGYLRTKEKCVSQFNIIRGDNLWIIKQKILFCYIFSSGFINIGNDVSIAHSTPILSTEHKKQLV